MTETVGVEVNPQYLALAQQFLQQIPFNQLLGIELQEISTQCVRMYLPMKPELVGNHLQGILHGGAIVTLLDVAGGAMALMGAFQRLPEKPEAEELLKLAKLGTIDMRVDYLQPGRGTGFTVVASLLRTGNKVAVTRMALHDDQEQLIATGTATYLVG